MIARIAIQAIISDLFIDNKIVIIYGPRQVGKTTMITNLIAETQLKVRLINGDELKFHSVFS